ncbi:MAG: uracil-DNA glycosylase [Bacteroidales bacterium]|nr:uracil-DNA glycosylase [Bacteroidales bacterium]
MTGQIVKIEKSWYNKLAVEFEKDYFIKLNDFLTEERAQYEVFPPVARMFSAFDLTPFDEVKVVIIGQDPYHGEGQAHGLCFSVPFGVKIPPSLVNIYKELNADVGFEIPKHGNLETWANQGVFLINATLSVRAHTPGSHQKKGWENFTDSIISVLSKEQNNLAFLLWGNYAKTKESLIDQTKHLVLKASHPSPLGAYKSFFGCRHFSKTNEYLKSKGVEVINWNLPKDLDLKLF